jgi:hypothetical protein
VIVATIRITAFEPAQDGGDAKVENGAALRESGLSNFICRNIAESDRKRGRQRESSSQAVEDSAAPRTSPSSTRRRRSWVQQLALRERPSIRLRVE